MVLGFKGSNAIPQTTINLQTKIDAKNLDFFQPWSFVGDTLWIGIPWDENHHHITIWDNIFGSLFAFENANPT